MGMSYSCYTPQMFLFCAGEASTSLLVLDGHHLAALRGTATWWDCVAEYVPHWATPCYAMLCSWTLRPLSGPASFHCGSFSPRPGWLSCACALHFLAPRTVSLGCPSSQLVVCTPYPCIMFTYPILSSLLSPAPPRHEYILNGTWRSHWTFPVASRYRYIPNTLGRKRLWWPRPFPACVHPFNYLRVNL